MNFEIFYESVKSLIGRYAKVEMDDKLNRINIKTNNHQYSYTKVEYEETIKKVKNAQECYLLMDRYYEVMLDYVGEYSYYFPVTTSGILEQYNKVYEDKENRICYSLGYASDEYLINYIINLKSMCNYLSFENFEHEMEEEKNDFFSLLRRLLKNVKTLKIRTDDNVEISEYNSYADAFLYNPTYNNNIVLKRAIAFKTKSILRRQRTRRTNEIIVPKRVYNSDLLEQYSIANSSFDPFIQFISYYHILEHFYESVYNENLINLLRLEMTSPSFSIKSDKNIAKIIEIIKKKTKQNNEEFDINECEALELLLRKNIKFDEIKEELQNLNISDINIYNETVKFCDGNKLNLYDVNNENNYKNLAKRIYRIRNALVHCKASEKIAKEIKVYRPFKDKEELSKEVPLMRIIAEKIIANNSQII